MDFSSYQKKISLKYFVGLSATILLGILFFGLNPRDFYFKNNVIWITEQPGIRFARFGIAYTEPIRELTKDGTYKENGFSIEIALKSESYQHHGFILVFHNGDEEKQLLVRQWYSSIMIMNGNDYDNSRKTKKITVKFDSVSPKKHFITITSRKDDTNIYLDGQIVRTRKDMTLKIPEGEKTRLLLGISASGKHSWEGDLYGLALYTDILSDQDVAFHFNKWVKKQKFTFSKKYNPIVLYSFDKQKDRIAFDHMGGKHNLEIPLRMRILQKEILSLTWGRFNFHSGFIKDIIINFAGFIPLGFILTATFIKAGGFFERHGALISVVLCFNLSLIIEILQVWMPSRSSSFIDLVLNTFGAVSGVLAYRFFNKIL